MDWCLLRGGDQNINVKLKHYEQKGGKGMSMIEIKVEQNLKNYDYVGR
jgi:hypothetical protein